MILTQELLKGLILEELTKTDKAEIKRMISKELDSSFKKELKKALEEELSKALSSKQTQEDIGEIAKKVIKKLYKDLAFHHPYIIDRIKI
jgi:UDP-galactopyranose mutase